MKCLIQSAAYVLVPSIVLGWFLSTSSPQKTNRLNSAEVRSLQQHDEQVQAEIQAIWDRIERQLQEHGWEKDVSLNPPATIEEIEALEKSLGYRLPADYKASLLVHNGSTGNFCSYLNLTSAQRSLWLWETYVSSFGDYADRQLAPNPPKVASYYWHPGWIPAACWDVYVVLVNVEDGKVYFFNRSDARYDARSWTAWLEAVAQRLETGEYRLEKTPSGRANWTDDDFRSPGSENRKK